MPIQRDTGRGHSCGMSFPVPARTHDLISRWWFTVQDAVQNLWRRCHPADGTAQDTGNDTAAPRLPRIEAGAISLTLSILEALVRRILVIMCAEYGPMPPPPEGESPSSSVSMNARPCPLSARPVRVILTIA